MEKSESVKPLYTGKGPNEGRGPSDKLADRFSEGARKGGSLGCFTTSEAM